MRILHVTADIGQCNGVASVILNYGRYMPEDIRFDILRFHKTDDDRVAELEAQGGHTYLFAPPGLHSFAHDDVDDFLEQHRGEYAALHLHLPYLASLLAPKARRAGIPKVVVHCHSTWYSLDKRNSLRNWAFNLPTGFLADQELACGRDAGLFWYGKRAMESGKARVLPNAIDCECYRFSPERRAAVRKTLGAEERLVVGHVGRVSPPQKNHSFVLRIFAEIAASRPDALLLLVGADPEEPLLALARELGIGEQVCFLGRRDDVNDLLQAMDVFLFPSFYEGLPVAAIEAQTAGLPVVMSEAVTEEACITARSVRLSLALPPEVWAAKALDLADLPRIDTAKAVVAAGFDLPTSAAWLAEYYRKCGA